MANITLDRSVSLYSRSQLGLGSASKPAVMPSSYTDTTFNSGLMWQYHGKNSRIDNDGWRDPNSFRYQETQFIGTSDGYILNTFTDNKGVPWFWRSILRGPYGSVIRWKNSTTQPKGYPYCCATGFHGVSGPSWIWNTIDSDIDAQIDTDNIEANAIMTMYRNSKDQPIHMGMFLAGVPETIRMIAETVLVLNKALAAFRKGKFSEMAHIIAYGSRGTSDKLKKDIEKKILRKKKIPQRDLDRLADMERGSIKVNNLFVDDMLQLLSSKWLEVNFGWLNLYRDVEGLFNSLPEVLKEDNLPRVTGRAVRFAKATSKEYTKTLYKNRSYGLVYDQGGFAEEDDVLIVRCDWKVGDPKLYYLNRFGLLNPLEVIWDRVPFSFVVDWFFPVQGLIESLSAEAGLKFLGGSKTWTKSRVFHLHQYLLPTTYMGYRYEIDGGRIDYEVRSRSTVRTTYTVAPSVPLSGLFRLPKSLWHGVTSLALLRQRFSKVFTFRGRA